MIHGLWEEQIILASELYKSQKGLTFVLASALTSTFIFTTFFSFLFHQHVQGPEIMPDTE